VNALVVLPILLPLLGAAASILAGRSRRVQRAISVAVLTASVGIGVTLVVAVDRDGPVSTQAGGWPAPLGITLIALAR
jgi:multicomponent Na+:H+ antiporter subunit D